MQIENNFGNYKILTRDTTSLLTLNEVKIALGYGTFANSITDPQLQALIDFVPHLCEEILNSYIFPTTGTISFCNFTNLRYYSGDPLHHKTLITLYKGNITQIPAINYLKNNVLTLVDNANYYNDIQTCKTTILAKNDGFPVDYDLLDTSYRSNQPDVVKISFVGGYDNTNPLPAYLKRAMLDAILFLFTNSPNCGCEGNCVLPQLAIQQLMGIRCPVLPIL